MWNKIISFFSKTSQEHNGKKVLLVEDSEVDRKIIENTLTKNGYHLFLAPTGEAGLELARKSKPNLIILDYMLPGMNGLDVCKSLKAHPDTKDIPILFLTCVDTPKNIIDCFEIGAENYLVKPITPKLLLTQVEMTLQDTSSTV